MSSRGNVKSKSNDKGTKKCILVNVMFSGNYLNENQKGVHTENIGHEWINLLAADPKPGAVDAERYLFITPSGVVDSKYDVDTVLFVRTVSRAKTRNAVEVIAKAEGCSRVEPGDGTWAEGEGVTYGGVPLFNIFQENILNGEPEDKHFPLVTFKAANVQRAKKRFLIECSQESDSPAAPRDDVAMVTGCQSGGETHRVFVSKCPNNQSLRLYIDDSREQLRQLIDNQEIWDAPTRCLEPPEGKNGEDIRISSCFLTIIGKLHDELSYSNMLAYFLRADQNVFRHFVVDFLGVGTRERLKESAFSVERESGHIDLLIRDNTKQYLIVIENKIKSRINVSGSGANQLTSYAKAALEQCSKPTIKNGKKDVANPDCGRRPVFFILTPEYNPFDQSELKRDVEFSANGTTQKETVAYKQLHYGALHQFFHDIPFSENENEEFKTHLGEFLAALKVHDRETDNLNEALMNERGIAAVRRELEKSRRNGANM